MSNDDRSKTELIRRLLTAMAGAGGLRLYDGCGDGAFMSRVGLEDMSRADKTALL